MLIKQTFLKLIGINPKELATHVIFMASFDHLL